MFSNVLRLILTLASINIATLASGGDLDPPGAPDSTPGPEPRTAINAENTPGDANSVYRITQAGSYYLTGNVTGQTGKSGIEIDADDVTLDLSGFSVVGVAGALDGIFVNGTRYSLVIHGGRVWGWPSDGVDADSAVRSRVSDITSTNNTGTGILVGGRCVVEHCIVDANTTGGIVVSNSCVVSDCVAQINGVGISIEGDACRVEGNTVLSNVSWGIATGLGVERNAIIGNRVTSNGAGGIHIWTLTTNNLLSHNTVISNTGTGIQNDGGDTNEIYSNVAMGNTANYSGVGLVVTSPTTSTGPWANISQ